MNSGRRALSIGLVLLGTASVVIGALLMWTDRNLFDTERVVATSREALTDQDVQELLRTELVGRITREVGTPFAGAVDAAVVAVLADPRFAEIFADAVRQTHTGLVRGGSQAITFDLGAVVPVIVAELATIDPGLAALFPDVSSSLNFELTRRSELPGLWEVVRRAHRAAAALVVFGTLLVALALVLGPSRWALVTGAGAGAVVFGFVVQLVSRTVGQSIENRVSDPTKRRGAVHLASRFTTALQDRMTTLMLAGGILFLVGLVLRLLRPAFVRRRPLLPPDDYADTYPGNYDLYR